MVADIVPVATGEAWIGFGVRSFRSVIRELIEGAQEQLVLTAYVLTDGEVVKSIVLALERGVAVTVYLYDGGEGKTVTEAAKCVLHLQEEFPYLEVKIVNDRVLHAKIIVADSRKVLVGSANLTHRGLTSNYELGFLIEDSEIAGKILSLVRKVSE